MTERRLVFVQKKEEEARTHHCFNLLIKSAIVSLPPIVLRFSCFNCCILYCFVS